MELQDRALWLSGRADQGHGVQFTLRHDGARVLVVSGKPLCEPVAWGGPIVMNTKEELREAFRELEDGTFLKHK